MKCEVLDNCVIAVGKGSIVEVSPRQYELARKLLKPLKEEKAKTEKVESVEVAEKAVEAPKKEVRKKKK